MGILGLGVCSFAPLLSFPSRPAPSPRPALCPVRKLTAAGLPVSLSVTPWAAWMGLVRSRPAPCGSFSISAWPTSCWWHLPSFSSYCDNPNQLYIFPNIPFSRGEPQTHACSAPCVKTRWLSSLGSLYTNSDFSQLALFPRLLISGPVPVPQCFSQCRLRAPSVEGVVREGQGLPKRNYQR